METKTYKAERRKITVYGIRQSIISDLDIDCELLKIYLYERKTFINREIIRHIENLISELDEVPNKIIIEDPIIVDAECF